jgi:hypothetical protein
MQQLLFGYRYLAISLFAMLAFATYLRTRDQRWMFVAGLLTGLSLLFRLTPAFAAACAIGVGVVVSGRDPRSCVRCLVLYGAGLVLVVGPVIGWLLVSIGPEKLWLEVVMRPVAMTEQQSLPMPKLRWHPVYATRKSISIWFVGLQFRAWTLLYLGYALALGAMWLRAVRARRAFTHPLLTAIVVWGGIYFLRSFGRSDSAHLYSAIPPVCLLLGHLASLVGRRFAGREASPNRRRTLAALAAVGVGLWIFLGASDLALRMSYRGEAPMRSLQGRVSLGEGSGLMRVDEHVETIRRLTRPGEIILDLTGSSLFYVVAGRFGPGYADIVMPGTFLSKDEERVFVNRLRAQPPALVIFPGWRFDDMNERSVQMTAPLLTAWVAENYQRLGKMEQFTLMVPRRATRSGDGSTHRSARPPDAALGRLPPSPGRAVGPVS